VRPAVTHVDDGEVAIVGQPRRTDRRAHAFQFGTPASALPDRSVRITAAPMSQEGGRRLIAYG
jgi:hypothetical protein